MIFFVLITKIYYLTWCKRLIVWIYDAHSFEASRQLFIVMNYIFCYIYRIVPGTLAQLVEQRTENPCVPGSIPGGTTLSVFILYTVKLGNKHFLRSFV